MLRFPWYKSWIHSENRLISLPIWSSPQKLVTELFFTFKCYEPLLSNRANANCSVWAPLLPCQCAQWKTKINFALHKHLAATVWVTVTRTASNQKLVSKFSQFHSDSIHQESRSSFQMNVLRKLKFINKVICLVCRLDLQRCGHFLCTWFFLLIYQFSLRYFKFSPFH